MATIAMPHIGDVGHLTPAARIGAVLVAHGHRVIAWAPEVFRARIERTGAEFIADGAAPTRDEVWSPQARAAALAARTAARGPELMQRFLDEDVDLVIHDYLVLWARVAGDVLGLPRIVSSPIPPTLEHNLAPYDPLDARMSRLPGLREALQASVERAEQTGRELEARWEVKLGGWRDILVSRAERTLVPSTETITGVPPTSGCEYVGLLLGPVAPRAVAVPRANRDRGEPPLVFASFGTSFNLDPGLYRTVLTVLADLPVTAILSTGGGRVRAADLMPVPPNVTVLDYVDDQPGLLAQADAFLTHAGSSSTHEGLLAGTPLVCVPLGADQFGWARRVEQLGAGVLAAPRTHSIRTAVAEVLGEPRYRQRAQELGHELATHSGEERLLDVVDRLLNASESPAGA